MVLPHWTSYPCPPFALECLEGGQKGGLPVLLLHGFPETALMWKPLIQHLGKQGYYCVAPNLRGYASQARPRGKAAYALPLLVADIHQLVSELDWGKFHLIGHDWGAGIGWKYAHDFGQKLWSWSALSVPHLQAFGEAIVQDKDQHQRSAYMRLIQIPALPELWLRMRRLAPFRQRWEAHAEEEQRAYQHHFMQPDALRAALHYYRANYPLLCEAAKKTILGLISVPTMFIWGNQDPAVGPAAVAGSHTMITGPYTFVELDTGHWLMQTAYATVTTHLTEHLSAFSPDKKNRLSFK
ncbi:MAG: alpha/beta hydrolase [Bacteroidota bacterium]